MISFGRDLLNDYKATVKKEWLITNGLGGYASSTVVGCNTRRYHGLLVAALRPPGGRTVLVSKLEEVIQKGEEYYFLSTNRYPNTISPEGYAHALSFSSYPFPKMVFSIGKIFVEKEIFMVHGENTTVVRYTIISPDESALFSFSPLIVCRDFHWLMRENLNFFGNVTKKDDEIVMKPFNQMPEIYIRADGMDYENVGVWYKNMEYETELARGLNFQEDLYNPGRFSTEVLGRKTIDVILSVHETKYYDVEKLRQSEIKRQEALLKKAGCKDDIEKALILSADKFIAKRGTNLKTVIAGYHWFIDWGRDAMVSIPGLLLETKRYDDAKKTLTAFANTMNKGIIPNRFFDHKEEPEYNTIDASLWFIYAGYLYYKETGDKDFTFNRLIPWFEEIYDNYMKGTLFNIRVDEDGLVCGGDETAQLTWMDAKVKDEIITKRDGKPVEVNILWYNAVMILQGLTTDDTKKKEYADIAKKIKESFIKKFWNDSEQCLYDVVCSDDKKDASIRPNQILAVSLKFPILDSDKEHAVFKRVHGELFTSFGLRSLSGNDESYIRKYEGNQYKRDEAYHQGTVWSWFIGPFVDAYIKLNGSGEQQLKEIELIMQPFYDHLSDSGIGAVSEIFDGDEPHTARGCAFQAWGVAEVLRIKRLIEKLRAKIEK